MRCRRCNSVRLVKLDVLHPGDNPVVRCRECGFLFSPGRLAGSSHSPGIAGPGQESRSCRCG